MERLVVLRCPTLLTEGERGAEARKFLELLQAVEELCPWAEAVRLGVCTLPARGPSRFFGGEPAFVRTLSAAAAEVLGDRELVEVGIAEGLFAGVLAARAKVIVPRAKTAGFLAPWSVAVLRRPELAVTLQRLGIHTLGQFAALPTRHVLARFDADTAVCHRVARAEEGDLLGLRDFSVGRRLQTVRGEVSGEAPGGEDRPPSDPRPRQPGFFGGTSDADVRAARTLGRLQQRLGPDAVLVGRLRGGRTPAERAVLVPWGSAEASAPADVAPWPGHLPPPSPVRVVAEPLPVQLVDASSRPLRVTGRGLLAGEPARLSVAGGPWGWVSAWAGPWPAVERWWSTRRRRARLQVITVEGVASLLAAEQGSWWLEAVYE